MSGKREWAGTAGWAGDAYRDKGQRQEDHRHQRQDLDIVALLNGAAALSHAAAREELLAQVGNLLAGAFVAFDGATHCQSGCQ